MLKKIKKNLEKLKKKFRKNLEKNLGKIWKNLEKKFRKKHGKKFIFFNFSNFEILNSDSETRPKIMVLKKISITEDRLVEKMFEIS